MMDNLIYLGLFFALVLALIKGVDNPKTAVAAIFLLLFLVKCVG